MGLETLGVLKLVIGAVSVVSQVKAAGDARKAAAEGRAIAGASEEVKNRNARRQQAKRLRITRSRIAAASAASNVSGSSGELGAKSALTSATGASVAQQQSEVLAAQGMSAAMGRQADAISRGKAIGAYGGLLMEGLDLAKEEKLFGG